MSQFRFALTGVLLPEPDGCDMSGAGMHALVIDPGESGEGSDLEVVDGAERLATLDAAAYA